MAANAPSAGGYAAAPVPAAPAAPAAPTAAASAAAASPADVKVRMPVQIQIPTTEERSSVLKNFTVYIVHVSDFGRSYQVERRFDDFAKLHAELITVDASIPAIPEKKMWASTDANTVAERRPAFERILRHMLRSEEVVMEKSQALFKFLELPPPGVVVARYLFKSQRVTYIRQCGKLLDPKYEKEHAYRLAHESVIKTSLHMLSTEGALLADAKASPPTSPGSPSAAKDDAAEKGAADASPAAAPEIMESPAQVAAEAEAAAVETLRWALANGGEAARKSFKEEAGLSTMLELLLRKGRAAASSGEAAGVTPDPRVRSVMNALIKAEGENFPAVFASFLGSGGLRVLASSRELLQKSQSFAELVSKLLWIAWDQDTQRAFLQGEHGREALGLLSALFECPSRSARACAGLLLSCLLASQGLLEGKEVQAAAGVHRLVEEMTAASSAWSAAEGAGGGAAAKEGGAADAAEPPKAEAEDELTTFVQGLGSNEERMGWILACADAPWRLHDGTLPDEEDPLWAGCAFALWCLLKMRPAPAKLAALRPALPAVAQGAPARVRWLAGELLLMLQLQGPKSLSGNGAAEGVEEAPVATVLRERAALELSLREQVEHSKHVLHAELEQSAQVIQSQRRLTEERQQCSELLAEEGWHRPLGEVLRRLGTSRGELVGLQGAAEARCGAAEQTVREVLQLELGGASAEVDDSEMDSKLVTMRDLEDQLLVKRQELAACAENVQLQEREVEAANKVMEQADAAVQDVRRQITELDTQISTKQRDAQSKRTMASSDFTTLKDRNAAEMESINEKQTKLRERALKVQAGEVLPDKGGGVPLDAVAAQQEMTRLKAEAAQLKARKAELQAEQQRMDADPQSLEQQAHAAEEAVQRLGADREALRMQLQALEAEHAAARETWQVAVTGLQAARQAKDRSDLECNNFAQQLDAFWGAWQPLWAQRLRAWRGRVSSLARAQKGERQLQDAVAKGWHGLKSERALRHEVLAQVRELQGRLAAMEQELMSVDDHTLALADE